MICKTKLKFKGLLTDAGNRRDSWLSSINLLRRSSVLPDEILDGNFRMSINKVKVTRKVRGFTVFLSSKARVFACCPQTGAVHRQEV